MERRKEKHLLPRNLLEVIALGLATPVLIIPAMLIILNAHRLGIWWLPLLLLYLLPFTTRQLFMAQRRERNRIRTLVGEEMYFTIYPRDLNKALRSAR